MNKEVQHNSSLILYTFHITQVILCPIFFVD